MNLDQTLHNPFIRISRSLIKPLLAVCLAGMLMFLLAGSAAAQTGVINGSVVNIRSGPGTSYDLVGTIYQGTEVTIVQKQGDWYKISYGKTTGWVSASYVTAAKASPTVQVTGETVNLRSGPGTTYNKVGEASRGDTLTLLDVQGDWYQVKTANGTVCYISASLAGTPSSAPVASPAAPTVPAANQAAAKQIKIVSGPINLRSGPGSDHDKVGMAPDQGVFAVLATQGEWYQIKLSSGTTGWVAGWLVETVSPGSSTPAASAGSKGTSTTPIVNLDGRRLSFEVPPIIDNGRTLVPLRAIFEAMGAHVEWNASTRTVTATKDGTKVILAIGSTKPTVNGQVTVLDVPAKIVDDRTLAPLRFVGEAFGGKVAWNQSTYTVDITSPASKGQPDSVTITDGPVNLRTGPASTYDKVASAETGEKLPILAERDGWYQVSRSGSSAWVASWVVQVAWEADEPTDDQNDDPVEETPPISKTPGSDVVWLSSTRDESGLRIAIESGAIIKAEITERSTEVVYEIEDRQVEGKYYFEEKLGSSTLTIKGSKDGDNCQVRITFPRGTEYRTVSEQGGKKEVLVIPNFIMNVERKTFGSSGERLIITTALPAKYTAQQKGDQLKVTLEGMLMGPAEDKYTFKDSDLIKSVQLSASGDTSTLVTINTDNLGKYSLGVGGDDGTQFNIMLIDKSAIPDRKDNLVVIDPGHGGSDPGARGSLVDEKVLNLELALMVGDILTKKGVDVEYTRDADVSVDLEERSEIANNLNAALFVSIHHNSTTTADKQGTETYYYAPPENPDLFMQKDERLKLATSIHQQLISKLCRPDRKVKQSNFSVLRNTQMPSALAEICFISNPDEQNLAMQRSFKEQAAQAVAEGILKYMGK